MEIRNVEDEPESDTIKTENKHDELHENVFVEKAANTVDDSSYQCFKFKAVICIAAHPHGSGIYSYMWLELIIWR